MGREFDQRRAEGAEPADIEYELDLIAEHLAIAHAREDFRRATGQLDESNACPAPPSMTAAT